MAVLRLPFKLASTPAPPVRYTFCFFFGGGIFYIKRIGWDLLAPLSYACVFFLICQLIANHSEYLRQSSPSFTGSRLATKLLPKHYIFLGRGSASWIWKYGIARSGRGGGRWAEDGLFGRWSSG